MSTLALLLLPMALTLAASAWRSRRERRRIGLELPGPSAGPWAEALAARLGLAVRIGVPPTRTGVTEGYWPHARLVTLSRGTWQGRSPVARAGAAHELGHAWQLDKLGRYGEWLLFARSMEEVAAAGTAALCVAQLVLPGLWPAMVGMAALAAVGASIAWLDEHRASSWARTWLVDLPRDAWPVADEALTEAEQIYAVKALARWTVAAGLLLLPPLSTQGLLLPAPVLLWTVVLLGPLLLLRTAQGITQLVRPQRMSSLEMLEQRQFHEASWDVGMGWVALVLVLATVGQTVATGLEPLVALAALPAWTPLSAIGHTLALVPMRRLHVPALPRAPREDEGPARERAVAGLLEAQASRPLWVRATQLLHLGALPLWVALSWRMLTGG